MIYIIYINLNDPCLNEFSSGHSLGDYAHVVRVCQKAPRAYSNNVSASQY